MSVPFDLENQKEYPRDFHERWRVHIYTANWGQKCLEVSCRTPGPNELQHARMRLVMAPAKFDEVPQGAAVKEPFLSETFEEQRDGIGDVSNFLQAIVDAAWEAGVRPEAMKDRAGELGATKAHLEDMRSLVFQRMAAEQGPNGKAKVAG